MLHQLERKNEALIKNRCFFIFLQIKKSVDKNKKEDYDIVSLKNKEILICANKTSRSKRFSVLKTI